MYLKKKKLLAMQPRFLQKLNTLIVLPVFCKTPNQRHTLTGFYSKVFILASNGVGDKFIIAIVKS